MDENLLEFPDVAKMASFIVDIKGIKFEIDSFECLLKGEFTSEIIAIAESEYGAKGYFMEKDKYNKPNIVYIFIGIVIVIAIIAIALIMTGVIT